MYASAKKVPKFLLDVAVQRSLSTSSKCLARKKCKILVVGCGSGGSAVSSYFSGKLGKGNVIVVEPNEMHYYQPLWTLVGAGVKTLDQSGKPMSKIVPKKVEWVKDKVSEFKPENNIVLTQDGTEIGYEYLVVAMGINISFDKIKGLVEALETPGVCSNYTAQTVTKTFEALKNFKSGNAIFTHPVTPIKCPGAPQKIAYLADAYFRKTGKRDQAEILFNTSLGVIFGVKKYANSLLKVVANRNIKVNFEHELIEVKSSSKEAVFRKLGSKRSPNETVTFPYEMLHVAPPMSPPSVIKDGGLSDAAGFLDVDKLTLQHKKFQNIFGLGDCTNVPTSRTAAAVAGEFGVLRRNLESVMKNQKLTRAYDGYTSCPLVTSFDKCILAEFDFDMQPLETFPLDQGVERRTMFYLKKDILPEVYWNLFVKGLWEGPKVFRKALHLGMSK